jgi:hypothetical protein
VRAASVIVATGGKSIPKMGATGFGYQLAESFGLPLVETRPGLVPLTFAEQDLALDHPLAGVALPAHVSCGRVGFDEAVLFTHRGLSGPAILQISSYWREGQAVALDLCPGVGRGCGLRQAKQDNGRALLPGIWRGWCRKSWLVGSKPIWGSKPPWALACPTPRWTSGGTGCGIGSWCRSDQRATAPPRSRWAGWIPMRLTPAPCRPRACRAFISWARWWMSPAGLAATTFNGPGRRAGLRDRWRLTPIPIFLAEVNRTGILQCPSGGKTRQRRRKV